MSRAHLPSLPLSGWYDTKMTLHLWMQILGKIRLALTPRKNHWWYLTSYVNSRGLTTFAIPWADGHEMFELQMDLLQHQLVLTSSRGETLSFSLGDGLSVSEFYRKLMALLAQVGIGVEIVDKPFDLPVKKSFGRITEYHHYDREAIAKFWHILRWTDQVFKAFSGRFYGKTCPVHLYWHSFDLAVTRFNGKKAPPMPEEARLSDKDAYSHECISFGFWPGDDNMPEPAYYSYTYPAPDGLDQQPLQPVAAFWAEQNGSPMALLKYHDLIRADDPEEDLLSFLESAYRAGAQLAGWPVEELRVPPLK